MVDKQYRDYKVYLKAMSTSFYRQIIPKERDNQWYSNGPVNTKLVLTWLYQNWDPFSYHHPALEKTNITKSTNSLKLRIFHCEKQKSNERV